MRQTILILAVAACVGIAVAAFHCGSSGSPATSSGTPAPPPTAPGDGASPPSAGADAAAADAFSPPAPPSDASSPPPIPGVDAAAPPGRVVAYASGYAPKIDVFAIDPTSGALALDADASVASFGSSPSFLAVNPAATNLYAVDENTSGQVGAYAIDRTTGALTFLNAVSSGGAGPPFVRVDATGKYVLVANYDDGTVSVLPILSGGKLGAPLQTLTVGAEAHMILPDPSNRFVFVPCKGADYVAQFLFDPSTGTLTPNAVPRVATAAGAGPRHLAFHPNGKFAYLISEVNSTMTAYAFDGTAGTLTEIETQSTLPPGFSGTNTCAEVWVHPSGAWVLGSNRGDDSIVVFAVDPGTGKMTRKGFTKTGGASPRDFTFDLAGVFLYAANETSNNVVPFRFDATLGTLTTTGTAVGVTGASFVGVVRLPAP
jgi:6-phosphogluconolactonase